MATISLCVITKNEQEMLGACLESARSWVEEIVVADTGSEDDTVAIAREYGAKVIHHTWQNDFSAARNAALAAATGDWILVLDADERLAVGAGPAIRRATEAGGFHCGMLPLHNAATMDASHVDVLSGEARVGEPQLLPRLLKRTPDLKWNGMIHESVTNWLVAGSLQAQAIQAHIVHFGAVPSLRETRNKSERNISLLQIRGAEEPLNPTPRGYLAYECLKSGDSSRARQEIDAAWALLAASRKKSASGPQHSVVPIANLRAHLQVVAGEIDEALSTLAQARQWNPAHPNLDLLRGVAFEQRAANADPGQQRTEDLDEALKAYAACLNYHGQIFSDEVNPGATSWAASTRMGAVNLLQERFTDARTAFEAALSWRPGHIEAIYGHAESLIHLGYPRDALINLEPHLDAVPEGSTDPVADGWILSASAAEAGGRWSTFEFLVEHAARHSNRRCLGLHRRKLLRDLLHARAIVGGAPTPGPGAMGHLSALIGRHPLKPPQGSQPAVCAGTPTGDLVGRILLKLMRDGNAPWLTPLFEPRAQQLLPQLAGYVEGLFSELGITAEAETDADFVLIGGAGRSGTTLFRAMIDAHPRMCCGPEVKLIPPIVAFKEQWWRSMGAHLQEAGVDEAVMDNAVRAFIDALLKGIPAPTGQVTSADNVRIAEKTPHNLLHMAYLGRLFPRARFIHVVRDGRAVAASLVKQAWIDPSTTKPLWYCENVGAAARYWSGVVDTIRAQAAQVPNRYLEVRYEALVSNPAEEMARVLAFLGEQWSDQVLAHQTSNLALPATESSSAAVADGIHTKAIDKWRRQLSQSDLGDIHAAAGACLGRLGYTDAAEPSIMTAPPESAPQTIAPSSP